MLVDLECSNCCSNFNTPLILFFFPTARNLCSLLASCVPVHGTEGLYYHSRRHIKYIREADDLADDIPLIVQTDYYHGNNNTGPFFFAPVLEPPVPVCVALRVS